MSSNKRARVSELASSPAELADSQKQVKTPFQNATSAGEQHPVPELGLSLAALESLNGAESAYFWLDIFVGACRSCQSHSAADSRRCQGAQHKAPVLSQDWWSSAFKQAVVGIGHTVLVLQPWDAPVPLTRSWCLWETFCTLDGGVPLTIVLSPQQRASFQTALLERFEDIATAMGKIDTRRAEAFKEDDQKMIYTEVEKSAGGFTAVNGRIHDRLRDWLADAAGELLGRLRVTAGQRDEKTLRCMNNLAGLLVEQGRHAEAEPLYREALRARRESLPREHEDTLGSLNNLSNLLKLQGKRAEAEPLMAEALAGKRKTLGDAHPGTLRSLSNLAILQMEQGELAEADSNFLEALAGFRRVPDATSSHTGDLLRCMSSLAILRRLQGKLAEAEALFREALDGHRRLHGSGWENHQDALATTSSFAVLLLEQGRLGEADPLLVATLRVRREMLGCAHADTLASIANLAHLMQQQGRLAEAHPLMLESLAGKRRTLGSAHEATLLSMNNLAWMMRELPGRVGEAVALARETVAGCVSALALGEGHPQTANTLDTLAACLEAAGEMEEAEGVRARSALLARVSF